MIWLRFYCRFELICIKYILSGIYREYREERVQKSKERNLTPRVCRIKIKLFIRLILLLFSHIWWSQVSEAVQLNSKQTEWIGKYLCYPYTYFLLLLCLASFAYLDATVCIGKYYTAWEWKSILRLLWNVFILSNLKQFQFFFFFFCLPIVYFNM